jgi:pilus assembly protein TadC
LTDAQIFLPLATFVGTLVVVVVEFLYSNNRITDLRTDVNNRFADMNNRFAEFNARFGDLNNRFSDFEKLFDAKLARLEEMMLHKFAELNDRLVRIENRLSVRE